MLNNENKVKPLLKEVLLCSLHVLKIEARVERIVFIVSMLMEYGSVKRGITLVELLRYINNSMVVDKVHHNKGKVLAVGKVVDMVGNMV